MSKFNKFKIYSWLLVAIYLVTICSWYIGDYIFEAYMNLIFFLGLSYYLYLIYAKIKHKENFNIFKVTYGFSIFLMLACFVYIIIGISTNEMSDFIMIVSLLLFFIHYLIIIYTVSNYLKEKSFIYYLLAFIFFPLCLATGFKVFQQKD
jgi:hypothetical protein